MIGVRNQNFRLAQDVARLKRENTIIRAQADEFDAMRTQLDAANARLEAYEAYLRTHSLLLPAQIYAETHRKPAETPPEVTP